MEYVLLEFLHRFLRQKSCKIHDLRNNEKAVIKITTSLIESIFN